MFKTLIVFLIPFLLGCKEGDRNRELAQRVNDTLNFPGGQTQDVVETQRRIDKLEDELNQIILGVGDLEVLYATLGVKYLDLTMYGPAEEAFSKAIGIDPRNYNLYYGRALARGNLAKTRSREEKRNADLLAAEADYLRVIELNRAYPLPYYGLAILYIYEFDRPFEAEPLLSYYVEKEPGDGRALLLYAQLLRQMGRNNRAAEQYSRILALEGYEEEKAQARAQLGAVRGR